MAVTYSPVLGLANIATGTESGQWGILTNTNICSLLEQAIAGQQNIAVANNASSLTLTTTQGAVNQARSMGFAFTGALSVDKPIIIPNLPKMYVIFNNTTGGANTHLVITPSGGSTTTRVLQGESDIIWCNGAGAAFSLFQKSLNSYLPLTGGTLTSLTPTNVTLTIKGLAGQTAPFQEWRDSANTALATITSAGNFVLGGGFFGNTVQTTGNAKIGAQMEAGTVVSLANMQVGTDLRVIDETYFGSGTFRAYTDATYDLLSYASQYYWAYTRSTGDLTWTAANGKYINFAPAGSIVATGIGRFGDATFGGVDTFNGVEYTINNAVSSPNGYPVYMYSVHKPATYAGMSWTMGSANYHMRDSGIAYAPVGWQVSSDRRLKSGFQDITNALLKVGALTGVTFFRDDAPNLRGEHKRRAGLIAQDVHAVLPEATSYLESSPANDPDGPPTMALDSMGVIALLVEAVKELSAKLAETRYEMGLDGGR